MFRKTREIAYFNNNLLVHAPNDVNAQHAGIEKCKWLRANTPALILLFEAVPRLGNWTFRSQDHSLLGAKVPGVELSLPGTFAPTSQ